ncbi:unnamed protein product [Phytophthora lilii]|uniref:Unnamed protein product n=1 Tax=Phytophthora lilii TaxID=2077276 RepID=A0A9W6TUH8_9STRA|nr:unnamed protein product [Phytophthora lilii]
MRTLAKMTRAALKIWQFVARYTTKPLLCQGVEGDMAMAKNSRRVFATADVPAKAGEEPRNHIAFDDKCKLLTPEKAALYTPPAPQLQVVALANWESAPTFVLDGHLGKGFPKASTDRLLNKCNPFLSGKRSVQRDDDISSEASTVTTDCSTIPENDLEDHELDIVEEEVDIVEEEKPLTLEQHSQADDCTADPIVNECDSNVGGLIRSFQKNTKPKTHKQELRWVCVGHGRYVKKVTAQAPKPSLSKETETTQTVRWVQVGHGRYTLSTFSVGIRLQAAP